MEIKYTYPNTLDHVVSKCYIGNVSPKPYECLLDFSYTFGKAFRRETPFVNKIYLSKYSGSCSFRIYVIMGFISKTLGVVAMFSCTSGGRRPLGIKYTYPNTFGYPFSEHKWLCRFMSKALGVAAWFSYTFRREMPFGIALRPSNIYHSGPDFIRIP